MVLNLFMFQWINQYWYCNEKPYIKITSLQFITPNMNLNDMYNTCCVYKTSILCGWLSPLGWWVDNYEQSFQSLSLYQAVYSLILQASQISNPQSCLLLTTNTTTYRSEFKTWQTFHRTLSWQKIFKRIRNHCHNGRTRSLGVIEIIFFSFAQ